MTPHFLLGIIGLISGRVAFRTGKGAARREVKLKIKAAPTKIKLIGNHHLV